MAYAIQALVGKENLLSKISLEGSSMIALSQGFGLIPFTKHLREMHDVAHLPLTDEQELPYFIEQLAIGLSKLGCLAYIEAEIFGGEGNQASIVWCQEEVVEGPRVLENAINLALRKLGVEKGDSFDRFEALGLGRHRSTDAWIQ